MPKISQHIITPFYNRNLLFDHINFFFNIKGLFRISRKEGGGTFAGGLPVSNKVSEGEVPKFYGDSERGVCVFNRHFFQKGPPPPLREILNRPLGFFFVCKKWVPSPSAPLQNIHTRTPRKPYFPAKVPPPALMTYEKF